MPNEFSWLGTVFSPLYMLSVVNMTIQCPFPLLCWFLCARIVWSTRRVYGPAAASPRLVELSYYSCICPASIIRTVVVVVVHVETTMDEPDTSRFPPGP